ncbi:MAG: hypothetical protein ACREXO_05900 [Advenella sp.]
MRNQTEKLDKLSFEFFRCFSLLEYALKAEGYVDTYKNDNAARIDYKDFIKVNKDRYNPSCFAASLVGLSPDTQVCINEELDWEKRPFDLDLSGVISCLKTIRNNLFHGGKRGAHGWFDSDRVHELLSVGLIVIGEIAKVDDNVFAAYSGRH